jgi:hypothetical protein
MELIETNEQNATRDTIRNLAAHGFSDHEIGCYTGIRSVETLQKEFLNELEYGPIDKNLEVAQSLFELATKGKSVTAATFWLRCRNGWAAKPAPFATENDVNVIFSAPYEDEE